MSKFKKGDVVLTPQDYEAEVTWAKEGRVGVEFTENAENHEGGMVYDASELTMVKRALHVPREEKDYKEMSVSELREAIRNLRNGRKESIQGKRKKRSSTRKSTAAKGKAGKKTPLDKLTGVLDAETLKKLKSKIKEGKK